MLNLKLNLKYTGIDQKAVMKYKEKIEETQVLGAKT